MWKIDNLIELVNYGEAIESTNPVKSGWVKTSQSGDCSIPSKSRFMPSYLKKPGNTKRVVFLVVMALLLVSGAMLFNAPHQTEIFQVNFPNGASLQAEVANTPEKLLFGLAFRERLRPDGALLLIFDESGPHTVWTKAFQMPVDLIWVDESKHIVHLVRNAEPCQDDQCPRFGPPPKNARYVIETSAGFIQRADVQVGHELSFALHM